MYDIACAVRFIGNLFRPDFARVAPRPTRFFRETGEQMDVDVYEPATRSIRGSVLFVHGMNVRAHRDPRLVVACQAMAASGFRAFAPRMPEVSRATISAQSVDRIVDSIRFVSDCSQGTIGVFAPSFSAAMSLVASARTAASGRVSGIFAMGSYCAPESVVRYLLEDESAHPYGRLIVLKNFLHLSLGPIDEIEQVLEEVVVDLGLRRIEPGDYSHFNRLSRSDRELLVRLLEDRDFRLEHARRMMRIGSDERFETLSIARCAHQMKVPVTLFHGEADNVIPPEESVRLSDLLQAEGVDVHLDVSPLISHGDTLSFWSCRHAVADAVRTFAHFFGHVLNAGRAQR